MTKTIFISHSADDQEILRFFREAFDDTLVKPVTMEYEKWSRGNEPNWKWITKEVKRSRALFVILTKNVVSKPQTQNWISFEIGVAAAAIPQRPVYVFMEESVDFPVPFLNHYFPNRLSFPSTQKLKPFSEMQAEIETKQLLQDIIKHPQFLYEDKMYRCSNCLTIFSYWGKQEVFSCPCCRSTIFSALHRYHAPKESKYPWEL